MKHFLYLTLTFLLSSSAFSQIISPPSGGSQKSVVTQYMGSIATVTVEYSSPSVKERVDKIWGPVVPYGLAPNNIGPAKEMPWRAGANENTIIRFSHDVTINGSPLKAGSYGFHIIPAQTGDWTLIFNKDIDAWGSYHYNEANDALRVKTKVREYAMREYLTFEFLEKKEESCLLALLWEKKAIPMEIALVEPKEIYYEAIAAQMRGGLGFSWENLVAAANFCLQNNIHLDQALLWSDAAVSGTYVGKENYTTLSTKAKVLQALNKEEEAKALFLKASDHPSASIDEIQNLGKYLTNIKQKELALAILTNEYEKHKGAWPTTFGLAHLYGSMSKYSEAAKFFKLAHEQRPDLVNKAYVDSMVKLAEKNQTSN